MYQLLFNFSKPMIR